MKIFESIEKKIGAGGKSLFLLIDPDKFDEKSVSIIRNNSNKLDAILVGGSLTFNPIDDIIITLKEALNLPIVIFPGNAMQVSEKADAILFLSLMSGRNPEFLIGNHVLTAPKIVAANLEAIPVGYLLIDGGIVSCAEYMSNTKPIPANKTDIALATALAAKLLGMKMIYLEAGSGASQTVPLKMVRTLKQKTGLPIMVGGGVRSADKVKELYSAGADIVVVGNHFENNPQFLTEL